MYNKQFLKYQKLKHELKMIAGYCGKQYFTVEKCKNNVGSRQERKEGDQIQQNQICHKVHVDRCFYPCIHYYMGNCKYGFHCHFSHSIRRQILKPEPQPQTCKKFYYQNFCTNGSKCKNSHDLRDYPCIYNSLGKCKYQAKDCRYSHEKKLDIPIPCFFNLMGECNNNKCQNDHNKQNEFKFLCYDGPL